MSENQNLETLVATLVQQNQQIMQQNQVLVDLLKRNSAPAPDMETAIQHIGANLSKSLSSEMKSALDILANSMRKTGRRELGTDIRPRLQTIPDLSEDARFSSKMTTIPAGKTLQNLFMLLFKENDLIFTASVNSARKLDSNVMNKWDLVDGITRFEFAEAFGDLTMPLQALQLSDEPTALGAVFRVNPVNESGHPISFEKALIEVALPDPEKQNERIQNLSLGQQLGLFDELNLPIMALINTGKVLQAVCHIGAKDVGEFKKRIASIQTAFSEFDVKLAEKCSNPGAAAVVPCIITENSQENPTLLTLQMGKPDFSTWNEWHSLTQEINHLPSLPRGSKERFDCADEEPLAEEIIEGTLRKGHRMMIAAPSKIGKSFLVLGLALCLALGAKWLGKKCKKQKVLLINSEVDSPSSRERERAVREKLLLPTKLEIGDAEIDELCLSGYDVTLPSMRNALIALIKREKYETVIIDPIYKLLEGDENSNEAMRFFALDLDIIKRQTGATIIYVHHFSKGAMNTYGDAINRASGSGVTARHAEVILTLSPLSQSDNLKFCKEKLVEVAQEVDIAYNPKEDNAYEKFEGIADAEKWLERMIVGGCEVDCSNREFATDPFHRYFIYFNYPTHEIYKVKKAVDEGSKKKAIQVAQNRVEKQFIREQQVEDAIRKSIETLSSRGEKVTSKNIHSVFQAADGTTRCQRTIERYLEDMTDRGIVRPRKDGRGQVWELRASPTKVPSDPASSDKN